MSIKPILFNTDEVRATLDGRKAVTRRVVKGLPLCGPHAVVDEDRLWIEDEYGEFYPAEVFSPYRPGDILYVRETWRVWRAHRYDANADVQFKAGGDGVRVCFANGGTDSIDREDYDRFVEKWYPNGRWRPSVHMPREAARIFLQVTDVRAERLQDITVNDLQSEGIVPAGYLSQYAVMTEADGWLDHFKEIWDSTIKPADRERYGWAASPWVWVIEFERCEKPEEG